MESFSRGENHSLHQQTTQTGWKFWTEAFKATQEVDRLEESILLMTSGYIWMIFME